MAGSDPGHVFINAPFDDAYEPLFVTLVGTLVFLGQQPHCVLEVPEKGDGRLQRILDLIRTCRTSVHELSRVGTPVRFNMPFELGLACALKLENPAAYDVFVLDSVDYRLDRTLSDYKGRDPLIHHGTSNGMVACLLDLFQADVANAPAEFRRAVRLLQTSATVLKADLKATSLFRPSLFRRLVATATEIAIDRGFIKP
ncbi:MAG: hypothetical protein M3P06_24165 [Acidobacteriota bacterium]|nr:hypothetical protein [Acidobacteriota bacterium]